MAITTAFDWYSTLVSQVLKRRSSGMKLPTWGSPLPRALDILQEGAALVEVGQGALFAHVGEAYGVGFYLL